MTESEFLIRFDRHLERADAYEKRGSEIMERSNQIMERSNQVMARSNQVMERSRESVFDLRTFIREINLRQERVTQRMIDQISSSMAESRAANQRMLEQLDDMRLATNQHTQALARVLDRLD